MKNTLYFLLFAAVTLSLGSCTMEKRRYMSGYHIEWKQRNELADKPQSPVTPSAEVLNESVATASSVEIATEAPVALPEYSPAAQTAPVVRAATANSAKNSKNVSAPSPAQKGYSFASLDKPSRSAAFASARMAAMDMQEGSAPDTLLLIIIAIFIPPLAVYLHQGSWNGTCWLNLLLTLLFYFPGLIHALIVILG
jgi:uncharacterized membrane protein YqaE (UPF0057 family)